jgi:hypothetical protein
MYFVEKELQTISRGQLHIPRSSDIPKVDALRPKVAYTQYPMRTNPVVWDVSSNTSAVKWRHVMWCIAP